MSSRSGFRTGVLSGRSARRPPTYFAPPGLCCPPQDCPSSNQQQPPQQQQWATVYAPSTPMIPAGLRLEWGSPSFPYLPPSEGNRRWLNLCPSVACQPAHLLAPWVWPIWAPMARGSNHTSTNPPSLEWCPPHCRVPATWRGPRSSAALRTAVMCGGDPALPPYAAKHLSTQSPWALLNTLFTPHPHPLCPTIYPLPPTPESILGAPAEAMLSQWSQHFTGRQVNAFSMKPGIPRGSDQQQSSAPDFPAAPIQNNHITLNILG